MRFQPHPLSSSPSPCVSFLSIKPPPSSMSPPPPPSLPTLARWKFRAICYRDVVRNPQPPRRSKALSAVAAPPLEISRPPQSCDVLVFYRRRKADRRTDRAARRRGAATSSIPQENERVENTNRPSLAKKKFQNIVQSETSSHPHALLP